MHKPVETLVDQVSEMKLNGAYIDFIQPYGKTSFLREKIVSIDLMFF